MFSPLNYVVKPHVWLDLRMPLAYGDKKKSTNKYKFITLHFSGSQCQKIRLIWLFRKHTGSNLGKPLTYSDVNETEIYPHLQKKRYPA